MKDAFRYGFIQCHEQFNLFPIIQCTPALIIHKTKGVIYFLLSCINVLFYVSVQMKSLYG